MNKSILSLAIPNIITNITVPLLGIVDLAILGHLDNPAYIGAIALGSTIFNIIYWSFGFLRMGTSGFTAQFFGANNKTEIISTFVRALLIAAIGGVLIIILQKPIDVISFLILKGEPDVELFASDYFYIRVWAAPATLGLYVFYGWFLGMQNAKYPMIIAIFVNISNIILDALFVFVFGMKADGVALGTLISQYAGLLLAIFLFLFNYKPMLKYYSKESVKQIKALKSFLRVNKDIMFRTLVLIFVLSFFTAKSAERGNVILAVNTLLFQFFFIFSYFIDGFAYAAEALTGKYFGAKDSKTLKIVIKKLLLIGLFVSIPFTIIYMLFGNEVLLVLTNNKEVLISAKPYLFWVAIIPVMSFLAFIWDGIYIGVTASKEMLITMLFAATVFFISYYSSVNTFGNHGLWFSFLLFLLVRGILQFVYAKRLLSPV